MKGLIDFSTLCSREGREMLDNIHSRRDKPFDLFELIIKGEIEQAELVEKIHSKASEPNKSFWMTKHRLYNRLVNTLLSSREKGTEIQKAYFECYRSLAAFKILRGKERRDASILVAEKTLNKAIKYQFSDVVFQIAKTLRYHYSMIRPSKKTFNKYAKLAKKYEQIQNIENQVEENFHYFVFTLNTKNRFSKKDMEIFKRFEQQAIKSRLEAQSYTIYILSGEILSYYYQITNQVNTLIQVYEETLEYLNTLPQMPISGRFSFSIKKIPAHICLGQYSQAQVEINQCLSLTDKKRINYQRVFEYWLILAFYRGDLSKVKEIIDTVPKKSHKERWMLFEAYYNILSGNPIKLGRFLNEVPVFSADKRGMNINILIIQILTYLVRNQHGKVIDRMLALERYTYRHLRADDTKRANLFIQMLLTLEKGRFKKISVQERSKKLLSKLKRTEITIQDVYNEVVPYERLWEFVLRRLG